MSKAFDWASIVVLEFIQVDYADVKWSQKGTMFKKILNMVQGFLWLSLINISIGKPVYPVSASCFNKIPFDIN